MTKQTCWRHTSRLGWLWGFSPRHIITIRIYIYDFDKSFPRATAPHIIWHTHNFFSLFGGALPFCVNALRPLSSNQSGLYNLCWSGFITINGMLIVCIYGSLFRGYSQCSSYGVSPFHLVGKIIWGAEVNLCCEAAIMDRLRCMSFRSQKRNQYFITVIQEIISLGTAIKLWIILR